jgi:hypothetical protein
LSSDADTCDFRMRTTSPRAKFFCRPVPILLAGGALIATTAPAIGRFLVGPRKAFQYISAPQGRPQKSRRHRRLLGRQSQGCADRLQARLDPAQGRRALQTETSRSQPGRSASSCSPVPGPSRTLPTRLVRSEFRYAAPGRRAGEPLRLPPDSKAHLRAVLRGWRLTSRGQSDRALVD